MTVADPTPGLLARARRLAHDAQGLVQAWLKLAELETLLTARTLVVMMSTGLAFALLLASSWLGLLAALAAALVALGVSLVGAILLVVLLNALMAWLVYGAFQRQSLKLGWPASLAALNAAQQQDVMSSGSAAAGPGQDDPAATAPAPTPDAATPTDTAEGQRHVA